MDDITQPAVNPGNEGTTAIAQFAQSPELVELARAGAQKYFELAQKFLGPLPAAEAHAELVHRLTQNYSTFAHEFGEGLMRMASDGRSRMTQRSQERPGRFTQSGQAEVSAIRCLPDGLEQYRTD